jgi:hypothetical protein
VGVSGLWDVPYPAPPMGLSRIIIEAFGHYTGLRPEDLPVLTRRDGWRIHMRRVGCSYSFRSHGSVATVCNVACIAGPSRGRQGWRAKAPVYSSLGDATGGLHASAHTRAGKRVAHVLGRVIGLMFPIGLTGGRLREDLTSLRMASHDFSFLSLYWQFWAKIPYHPVCARLIYGQKFWFSCLWEKCFHVLRVTNGT